MRNRRAFSIASLFAVALTMCFVSATRAGRLDRELIKNSAPLIQYLSKQQVKNVGILPFEVKKGSRKASVDAAPLATSMPTRLENTLIMALQTDSFGVVRNPAGTARKAKVGDSVMPEYGREPNIVGTEADS